MTVFANRPGVHPRRHVAERRNFAYAVEVFEDRRWRVLGSRSRHAPIAFFRNWNRIQSQAQPTFQAFLRAVMLAMRQRSQLNRAPHVTRIGHRGCQLINGLVPPLDYGSSDQSHSPAN